MGDIANTDLRQLDQTLEGVGSNLYNKLGCIQEELEDLNEQIRNLVSVLAKK